MDALTLARWQFGITTIYHFFFVPLTLGLSLLIAIMETVYVRTGNETYKKMAQFWGRLFLINFAMGVATGIVQEFQFGMNWSSYSRFVGDIFGAPLAIEALLAFFLESTFLGMWIFGWDKLPRGLHLLTIWLVVFGSNLSALWILIANSFMQQPVGFTLRNGRAEMTNFFALLTNPNVWVQFPHVLTAGICTASFFVIGISAYKLLKRKGDLDLFRHSAQIGIISAVIASILVAMVGHTQAQHMVQSQPMKMAAAEALWNSEDPASFSIFTIGNEKNRKDVFAIRIPDLLSILSYNTAEGQVQGINELQAQYVKQYGPGNYVPPVGVTYWSFRLMVGSGMVMILLSLLALFFLWKRSFEKVRWFLWILPFAMVLPYLANAMGWIMTEIGRQPWIVFGLLRTSDAVSPTVNVGSVLASLIIFTLLYGALAIADIYLLAKYVRTETPVVEEAAEDTLLAGAY
ncbi:cytochrome ubiquinol oxidase subunit I [Tengunoibacter tsumagoiensis]|uniref:Cytochrome ubiquinol oxidase subunit I n=1 Tax=Tengunoibacter tsumagoiensis TaxID=2014871 RepID=A0A402A346_9CHLR|nr:cytochrome ubiquinol oxidase subunit I [Tengunoibacter tsumagoiensis]GCE13492.1 cytochrome ubiquinol oxidase subunit I [Tengunoibacter tsumagoiensis]